MYDQNSQSSEEEVRKVGMRVVTLLECTPGNRTNAQGEPVTMITMAHGDDIETIAFNIGDTKSLIIDSLISLREAGNEFAEYLLETYFVVGEVAKNEVGPFEEWTHDSDDDEDEDDEDDYDHG